MHRSQKEILRAVVNLEKQIDTLRDTFLRETNGQVWIDTKLFADICGMNRNTISNYCREGRIKRTRIGNRGNYEIHIDELRNF